MIVDSHVHLAEPPYKRNKWFIKGVDGTENIIPLSADTDLSTQSLISDMKINHIGKALVVACSGMISNEELSKVVKSHSKQIIGFAWVDYPKNKQSVDELDFAVNELGLRGLKLHPGIQNFSPADQEILPLIKHAANLKIPVFIHMVPNPPQGDFNTCLVEYIVVLWKRVPEATVLIGHMGVPRWLDLLTIAPLPNIYVETSWGLTMLAELYGLDFTTRFIRKIGVDNIVFGSDWLGEGWLETKNQLDLIQKLNLSVAEKEKILGDNINAVLERLS
ncbi:MAG: amidohydrolase family protein [Candidatus Heimdallarchaeaceae archaeon]